MRLHTAATSLLLATATTVTTSYTATHAFSTGRGSSSTASSVIKNGNNKCSSSSSSSSLSAASVVEAAATANTDTVELDLTIENVKNVMKFRDLQRACRMMGLEASGSTAMLKTRLLDTIGGTEGDSAAIAQAAKEELDVCVSSDEMQILSGVSFSDEGDKDFEKKDLMKQIQQKCERGHWKSATRKLKKLQNRFLSCEDLAEDTSIQLLYTSVLKSCAKDRLHGARAAESARKIIEIMGDNGMPIRASLVTECVSNCVGFGPGGTHEGFGGIDPALAMLHAIESSCSVAEDGLTTLASVEAYTKILEALCTEGVVEEAMLLLRAMVVEHSFTPTLTAFAAVSAAAVKAEMNETVLQVMTLAKAAGYELDSIASAAGGRLLLADGVIVAERIDNLALGLRLLTAAQKAEGCLPDRGDDLVASASAAAQRASTLIHKRAVHEAVISDNWQLAVRILELMPKRSLTPATSVWRDVVTVCAKNAKSRKATGLLMDWLQLSGEGKVEKPQLSVFNTVMNACEICGEEELTLLVLEAMKKTHDTDGNIITFNIALKRFAKLGNAAGCEGIIIGMLKEGIEPTIVSYTTAIAACVNSGNSELAEEWLKRIRLRGKKPNFHTYNTALAACLDGKMESTNIGSRIAESMMKDVLNELENGVEGNADFYSSLPDTYTKKLVLSLMKQLRDNWRAGDIDMRLAKTTLRVPFLKLVDFNKSDAVAEALSKKEEEESTMSIIEYTGDIVTSRKTAKVEEEIDYNVVRNLHKRAEV